MDQQNRAKLIEALSQPDSSRADDIQAAVTAALKVQGDLFLSLNQQFTEAMQATTDRLLSFAHSAIDVAIAKGAVDPVQAHATLREARAAESRPLPPPVLTSPSPEPLDEDSLKARIIADTHGRVLAETHPTYGMTAPSGLPRLPRE